MAQEEKNQLIEPSEEISIKSEKAKVVKEKNLALKDGKQMNNFLGPVMKEIEDAVAEQMKYLDQIEEELNSDTKLDEYNRLVGHIPKEIRGSKSILTIFKNLGTLLNETIDDDKAPSESIEKTITEYIETKKNEKSDIVKTDDLAKLASFSGNLCLYLLNKFSRKDSNKLKSFTAKIYDAVNLWISKLFRFKNSALLFYEDETDGFIRLCSMLLNYKFNDYKENGYESIKKKPLIYISEGCKYASTRDIEMIALQLGLPVSCFRILQVSKKLNDTYEKIDTKKFENDLEEDIKSNFIPMLLITSAGNHRSGHCDNLNEINRICYKYRIWLHLDGFYLSTLALYSVPTAVQPVWSGDSVTLDLATWLGIPCLSYITIYRNVENSGLYIKPFNNYKSILQRSFPYWTILQAMGHEGVIERIRFANQISINFSQILEDQKPYIKKLNFYNNEAGQTSTSFNSLSDLFVKALSFLTFVDLNNPVSIFKFDPKYVDERLFFKLDLNLAKPKRILSPNHQEFLNLIHEKTEPVEEEMTYSKEIIEYTDSLTTWLFESLNEKHNMEFELLTIENEGVCIRYCPIDHVNIYRTTTNDVDEFSNSFTELMKIIDSSIRCKAKFGDEIKQYSNLISLKVDGWAGVGSFRYIPDYLMHKIDDIKEFYSNKSENSKKENESEPQILDNEAKEINDLNQLIIKKLQSEDTGFSSGEATDGFLAIKFGMIQDIDSLKKLFNKVLIASKEIEESSRFIETMTDLVRQGIEKANQDLKKETEQKLVQEGILRQIPLVGGLFSWISPSPTVNSVGRTFNLQSGKILTTETIYKYHIQVEQNKENKTDSENTQEELKVNLERKSSSDTVQINDSNQLSELSSDELNNETEANSDIPINLK